ncbi:MAG: DUF1150 family protein [Rubricella sp.]
MSSITTHNALPDRTVYVRTIRTADLPDEIREQTEADTLYAIHDADGQQLALVDDRALAFRVAREHEMAPVSVH